MRQDMPKRFLKGSRRTKGRFPRGTKKLTRTDDGESVQVMGMKRVHRFANKFGQPELELDFAVMRRFLMRRRGQPWDKVYSEICTQADGRSFEGSQFREWLLIEQNCYFDEDGKLVNDKGMELRHWTGHVFYVHPETKTLEYIDKRFPAHRWDDMPQKVFEMDGVLYHQHKGLWYRVKMEVVPITNKWGHPCPDYDHAIWVDAFGSYGLISPHVWDYRRASPMHILWNKYGLSPSRRGWYCVEKQSANKKEIARLKKKHNLNS